MVKQNADRIAAEEAARAAEAARQAQLAADEAERVRQSQIVYNAPQAVSGELTGSIGYAIAGGNCVNQVPAYLRGQGNPINWTVLTLQPYIGGAALWYFNHTARVVGLWSNGDIEVAQENFSGGNIHRYPRSAFRGFR